MLISLEIENFALVERLTVPFGPGLNVLTGETGAGKSILLDALQYLLGGPHAQSRPFADKTSRVTGLFSIAGRIGPYLLDEDLIEQGDQELLLSRDTTAAGRSSSRIQGRLVSLPQLRGLADLMIEIHGQHQSTTLLKPSKHQQLLDEFAGPKQVASVAQLRSSYGEFRQTENQLGQLLEGARSAAREKEWLEHEAEEIRSAKLQPDEEGQLDLQLKRLSSLEEICTKVSNALSYLEGGEQSAANSIGRAQRLLTSLTKLDPELNQRVEELEQSQVLLAECAHNLNAYLDRDSGDPRELERLSERKSQIQGLKRKYGASIEEVLEYLAKAEGKLDRLQDSDQQTSRLQEKLDQLQSQLKQIAKKVRQARDKAAKSLQSSVEAELVDLHLEKAKFAVQLSDQEMGASGDQNVEFMFSANPGSPLRPLHKVASGGELSRLLLALLVLLDRNDPVATLVFDEVDSGLGGRAAEAVASKLQKISTVGDDRQIVCVTHLPVIAASADHHLRVVKSADSEFTHLFVGPLDEDGRELEIARMLSGDATPDAARTHARELLQRQRARRTA